MTAETIRTQALAVRSQESLDSATRVMEWYLKNAQVEVSALRQQRDELADRVRELEGKVVHLQKRNDTQAASLQHLEGENGIGRRIALEETNRELADALEVVMPRLRELFWIDGDERLAACVEALKKVGR